MNAKDTVIIALEDWGIIQETLYLTSTPDMKESLLQASKEPLDSFSKNLKW